MNELKVNGTQKFMGFDIPVIEGGFGENCKVVTAKTVSEIHKFQLKEINQSINRLIKKERMVENIDYINLFSSESFKVTASDLGLITSNGQKQCFILSERGYSKLIKYMDDDESWNIMDKFIDEYFSMRKELSSIKQKKAMLLLTIYDGGQDAIVASKELSKIEVKEATAELEDKIEEQKPSVEFANQVSDSTNLIDIGKMAKLLNKDGIDIGRNKLYEFLRNNKILMEGNIPYQKYINSGYFKVKETVCKTSFGFKTNQKTYVTGKGQLFIAEKLRKEYV